MGWHMHTLRQTRWITALAKLATPARLATLATLAMLAACETAPSSPAKAPPKVAEPAPVAASAPAAAPVVVEVAPPLPPGSAQKYVSSALELLELGKEEEASAELQRALAIEPGHRLALNLQRQISADPVSVLGRESFMYRVQPGETLSRIAQRFMGDVHLFYILARYNDIKVPKLLSGGQLVRVPGKVPLAAPIPSPAPAVAAPVPPAAAAQRASSAADAAKAEREQAERAERERKQAVANATRAARQAFARQDLNNAIAQWDRVLELEPGNATAKLEKQRAVELRDKLGRVK
jgi:tetratricopeptide (TPR) repeat protein